MAFNKIKRPRMWLITIKSKRELLDKDRDFIAELVSEDARKTCECYKFILHDIIESKRYSKVLIEGTKIALENLLEVIKDNLPYNVNYMRYTL